MRRLLTAATVGLLAIASVACEQDTLPDESAKQDLMEPGPPEEDGAGDVAITGGIREIFGLEGETVIISGTVTRVPAPGVFALRSDILGKSPLWVVSEPDPVIAADAQLSVEGVVVPVEEADIPSGVRPMIETSHVVVADDVRTVAAVEAQEDFLEPDVEEEAEIEAPDGEGGTTTTARTGGTSTSAAGESTTSSTASPTTTAP